MKERAKILVVEDNLDNRRILVYRLKRIGDFQIVEASNGQEAIALVESDVPDYVAKPIVDPNVVRQKMERLLEAAGSLQD